jgi:hypothetical protein
MSALGDKFILDSEFAFYKLRDENIPYDIANLKPGSDFLVFNKLAVDNMHSSQKEIQAEIAIIQLELSRIRSEMSLIRSDFAKVDTLKWSVVLIVAVMSFIGLLIIK